MQSQQEQILHIQDGFRECFRISREQGGFDVARMVEFMEPRFAESGYRGMRLGGANILLLHDSSAGDFIAQSAAVREIRRVYPDAFIVYAVSRRALALAEFCPYVDEIIVNDVQDETGWFRLNEVFVRGIDMAGKLLPYHFDIAFAFEFDSISTTALLAYMSGAKVRISSAGGKHKDFRPVLTTVAPQVLYGKHAVDSCLALLEHMLFLPVSKRNPEVWIAPQERFAVRERIGKKEGETLYGICAGGTQPSHHWPLERYAELLERIRREEPSVRFLLIGGLEDVPSAAAIQSIAGTDAILDLTGKLSYRESAAALGMCDCRIGNDTGTAHIAAALGTPVLNISSFPADVHLDGVSVLDRWHPRGAPAVIVQPREALPECRDSQNFFGCIAHAPHCITQITADLVFKALRVLHQRAAAHIMRPCFFR